MGLAVMLQWPPVNGLSLPARDGFVEDDITHYIIVTNSIVITRHIQPRSLRHEAIGARLVVTTLRQSWRRYVWYHTPSQFELFT